MLSLDYWRHDVALKLLNVLFTAGSCGLSAYAGWLLAHDLGRPVQIVTAVIFGAIAYGLSMAVQWRTQYKIARDREGFARNGRLALFLLIANLLTDYSASSTLRDQANVTARNANNLASMAQNEVKRLEKAIADLRAETAWRTKFEAPETYSALIAQQKQVVDRGANVWNRTKQCTDTTLEISSRVCSKIKELEATKANAERRQVILSELKTLGDQLAQAKQEAAAAPEAGNPALAPIIGLVTLATQSLKHGEGDLKWGLNYFVLSFTIIISAAIWYLSTEIGYRAGPMLPPEPIQPRPRKRDYWLEAPEDHPSAPIPLKATDPPPQPHSPAGGSSITVHSTTTRTGYDADAIQRLMKELEDEFGLQPKH